MSTRHAGDPKAPAALFVWLVNPFFTVKSAPEKWVMPEIWHANYIPVGEKYATPIAKHPLNSEAAALSLATLAGIYPAPVRPKEKS